MTTRHQSMPVLIATMLWTCATYHGAVCASEPPQKPNVVIIYTDDQPKSQFGCYGGVATPHIDRLAAEGMMFNRFYVSTALCAPSRYGLQTGRYASRSPWALREFPAGGPIDLEQQLGDEENRPPEKFNLPSALKDAGYATGIVGKYHLGFMGERYVFKGADDKLPIDDPKIVEKLRHNFRLAQESAYAAGYTYAEALYHDNLQPQNFPVCAQFHNMEWITWKAQQFIEANRNKPFFLVVAPTLVHFPQGRDKASLKADRRITALGQVEGIPDDVQPSRESVLQRAAAEGRTDHTIWLDDAIGAIMKKLSDLGLDENTIILVIADNGTTSKWTCYEGGVNTGCVVRWKTRIPAGVKSDSLMQNVDIAPTLFEICGVKPPVDAGMDGVSFAGHWLKGTPGPRQSVYVEIGYQRAVVAEDRMKYLAVRFPEEIRRRVEQGEVICLDGKPAGKKLGAKTGHVPNELFALTPGKTEGKNLAADPAHAAVLARMKSLLREYCQKLPHAFGEFKSSGGEKK